MMSGGASMLAFGRVILATKMGEERERTMVDSGVDRRRGFGPPGLKKTIPFKTIKCKKLRTRSL
jgi:hypothetical protein